MSSILFCKCAYIVPRILILQGIVVSTKSKAKTRVFDADEDVKRYDKVKMG